MNNQTLQGELQQQQLEISRGNLSQQVGTGLVREIASKALTNAALKDLLTRNGFVLNENAVPPLGQQPQLQAAPTATANTASSARREHRSANQLLQWLIFILLKKPRPSSRPGHRQHFGPSCLWA